MTASDPPGFEAELRRYDRDRYLAALWAPEARRGELLALLAFGLDIARLRETVSQPMLGQIRLQWWREAIDDLLHGRPARRHPILEVLAPAIRDRRVSASRLMAMLDAREHDWDEAPPTGLPALEAYAEATAGQLAAARLAVLGAISAVDSRAGLDLGGAWAIAGLVRAIPFHAGQRRLYIPGRIASETGLDAETVFAGKTTPALRHAVAVLCKAAAARLVHVRGQRGQVSKAGLPVLAEARLVSASLRRIAGAGFDPFTPRLALPDTLAVWRLGLVRLTGRY